jgi:hypothetical protein
LVEEVSWGVAFRQAIKYVVYYIIWLIIGGSLLAIGAYAAENGSSAAGIPLIVIGVVILLLGGAAALFKAFSGVIYEVLRKYHGG